MPDTNTSSASENPERPRLSLRLKKDSATLDKTPAEKQVPAAPANAEPKISKPRLPLKLGNVEQADADAPAAKEPTQDGANEQVAAEAPVSPKAPPAPPPPPPPVTAEVAQPTPPPVTEPVEAASGPVEEPTGKPAIPAAPPPRRVEAPPPPRRKEPQAQKPARGREKQQSHFMQVGLVAVILLACGIGIIYLFTRLLPQEETVPAAEAQQAEPAERPQAGTPARPTGGPAGIFDKVNAVTDQATVNTQAVNDVIGNRAARSSAQTAANTPAAAAESVSPAATGSQRIHNRVESYPVSLVMPSSTGGRIVIDNVVYRAGDLVEPSIGLRFKTVEPANKRIVFQDETGALYYKSY